jgi:uncharacterized membrane protein
MPENPVRARYALGATIAFAIVAAIYVAMWVATRSFASGMLAMIFVAVTIIWACVCVKWRRQR